MNIEASINRIFLAACPAIQYRVRKELLRGSPFSPEMIKLQDQILRTDIVKKVINSQGPDGWLGWSFHGYDSMESGIRLLCENGVEANQPVLTRALDALEKHTDRLERGLGRVGRILDDLGFGGAETIRAYLFAHAGNEEIYFVKKQIGRALDVFKSASQIGSLECLYEPHKGRIVFREGVCWPSIYHLRLLAMSRRWRTPENCKLVAESIQQIVRLSPIPDIHVRHKSQLIAPASFCMDDFKFDLNDMTDDQWMLWFHRLELLARLGVVNHIPDLKQQAQTLANLLRENQGLFTKNLSHTYFSKWGAYTGLALERDWRIPQRRINDLTFRSLLILHFAASN